MYQLERCSTHGRGHSSDPRFSITVTVGAADWAYDDPERVADAAAGVLANVYGYDCFLEDIAELVTPAMGSTQ